MIYLLDTIERWKNGDVMRYVLHILSLKSFKNWGKHCTFSVIRSDAPCNWNNRIRDWRFRALIYLIKKNKRFIPGLVIFNQKTGCILRISGPEVNQSGTKQKKHLHK